MADSYYQHLLSLHKGSPSVTNHLRCYRVSETAVFEGSCCWEWTKCRDKSGYGKGATPDAYAHRSSHKLFIAPIPSGLEVDHKCRNRACGNPQHLRLLTHADNMKHRSEAQTECSFGHPYTPENTHRTSKGERVCKMCRVRRTKEWRERHPEAARKVSRDQKKQWRAKRKAAKLF